MTTKPILITGAEGYIGSFLREALQQHYDVRLVTREAVPDLTSTITDITNLEQMRDACSGVQSIIHLAASSQVHSSWEDVLHNNIQGTYTILEAARQAGVPQVIFASTNHAVAANEKDYPDIYQAGQAVIDHQSPLRADSFYGVSKGFGEILGRFYADHYGLRVICLRIGWVGPEEMLTKIITSNNPWAIRLVAIWQSARDLTRLIESCLTADHVQFDVFYGVSNNKRNFYDLSHARAVLGYIPLDCAEDYSPDTV